LLSLRLFNYLRGYLVVEITGVTTEKLINLCTYKGIYLWDIKWRKNSIISKIHIDDFRRVRPLARKTHCSIKIKGRYGLPFFVYSIRNRKMLLAGGLLFCICLYVMSSFIWFVRVSGLTSLQEETVLNIVRQAGLKPGVQKNRLDLKHVEHLLLLQIPEISWTGITIQGTRAVVEIAEKTMEPVQDKTPAHIIASKDGLMEEIIALVGETAVQRGETVRKGQVLISGTIMPRIKDEAGNMVQAPNGQPQQIRAQGITKARIWYQAYGESSMIKQVRQRTGRTFTHVVLKAGQWEKIVKEGIVPFGDYEIEQTSKKPTSWRNKDVPVESNVITFYETVIADIPLTPDEAREEAKRLALEALRKQIPEDAQVLSRNIEVIKTSETDIVRIKVVVETLEDIGNIHKINNVQ